MPSRRAGYQVKQSLKVSIETQRQFFHLPLFNFTPCISAVRFQNRRFRCHYYLLGDLAGYESQVHPRDSVHHNIYSRTNGFLESLFLGGDFILTWGEITEFIIPIIIGRGTTADARLHFRGSHLRPGYDCSAGIRHRSEQRCINRLPHDRCRKPQECCPEHHGHAHPPQFDQTSCGTPCEFSGIRRIIHAAHPWEIRTKQFFHDITPLASKRLAPVRRNQR